MFKKAFVSLISCILILLTFNLFGHIGGHGKKTKRVNKIRTWHLHDNAEVFDGSFMLLKDELVHIEIQNGEIKKIPLQSLSWVDQKYAKRKNNYIQKLNRISASEIRATSISKTNITSFQSIIIYVITILSILQLRFKIFKDIPNDYLRIPVNIFCLALCIFLIASCNSESEEIGITDLTGTVKTDVTFLSSAFEPYSNVTTSFDDNYFYVESNGIPDHQMMVNITAWIAQVPLPQPYSGNNAWSIPLNPEYSDNPISIETDFQRGAIAIAANGIPIFNPINASGLISNEIGELDDFGGHSGRADDYHYHIAPLHLESTSGTKPIAFAFDGFAIYGSKEPDGSAMETLDQYHGHVGSDGIYHYHGTETYPYMIASMRGKVNLDPNGASPYAQIVPQAGTTPLRGNDPHPINGNNLIITSLAEKESKNGYSLEYTIDGAPGSVDYSWDENELYTFIFNDVNGTTTTETFQR